MLKRINIPKINRYKINNFRPLYDMYLTNKLIDINEDKNVVNNPTNKGKKGNDFKEFTELINSTKATKVIAGIPRRNEYLAASFLSHPESIAIEIVAPERDTPGIIAND